MFPGARHRRGTFPAFACGSWPLVPRRSPPRWCRSPWGRVLPWATARGVCCPALAALVGAVLIQVGTNLINDYYDFKKGADTQERLWPTRVTQSGLLSAGHRHDGALGISCALAATLVGLYLTAVAGWPIVVIGLASLLAGYAYTGGPYPLGYHGLGDLFVFVFFGLVAVAGTFYVQAGNVIPAVWPAAAAVGAMGTELLVVNNLRDATTDAKAGKRTLVVRFGVLGGKLEYLLLLALAYADTGDALDYGRGAGDGTPAVLEPALGGGSRSHRDASGRRGAQCSAG